MEPLKHHTFQKMSVGRELYAAYLDGKDIVLRAIYSNTSPPEIRITGTMIKEKILNQKEG